MSSSVPAERLAAGANYSIDREGDAVVLRVWSRPDLSFEVCAQLARDKVAHLKRIVTTSGGVGLLIDLTHAAAVIGPKTEAAVLEMIHAFADQGRAVVVIARDDSIRQKMQFERIVRVAAGGRGHVTSDLLTARTLLRSA